MVAIAVVSAAAMGVTLAQTVNTTTMDPAVPNTAAPTDGGSGTGDGDGTGSGETTAGDGETGTDDESDGGAMMLVETSQPSGGVADEESATLTVTVKHADGSPVEGTTLQLTSIGAAGEFDPGTEIETDSDGTASVKWYYIQPDEAEDFSQMPPSEQTSIAVETTVDGTELAKFATIKLDIDPYREGCHSEGEDLSK